MIIWTFPTYIPQRKNIRKLPYKEVDVTYAWNEQLRLAQSAHVTNQRALPAGYELRKVCFRLDCTFILWRNQLQNHQFPVINEHHLVEGRGHAKHTAEKQPKLVGRRKKADESLACSQLGESETATLTINGDAEILRSGNQQAPAEQPNDPCMARKKIDRRRGHLGPTNDATDTEQKRCFVELASLQSLFTDVACGECGAVGSLDVSFGEKMGYSSQIRLVCQVRK